MSRIGKGGRGERSDRDRQRDIETALRLHLEDDVNMSDEFRQNHYRRGGRGGPRGVSIRGRRNSPVPLRGTSGQRQLPRKLGSAPGNWYKVIISYAAKYKKEYVLEIIFSHIAPETFVPIMYKVEGNDATFYVDETKTANKLLSCDRLITATDGFKLGIRVRPGFPQVQVDQHLKDRIKIAMGKRYVATTNALDLSEFHRDPDLCQDLFCALFRPQVLVAVMDIVGEHTPNLEALNLDGNKLQDIDRLGVQLRDKLPGLTILYLGNNRIREWREIDALKQLKLKELRLTGNPLCEKYKQRPEDFVSDVRKRFPKLLKLDGTDLPPPIVFDVAGDDGAKLPPTQRAFAVNNDARQVAATFLHQYFLIFDTDNRQPLLDAYDEQASFSLTISCTHDNLNRFNKYLPHNRNLFRVNDRERRQKLLKQGRLPVVSFLSEIPKTKHFLNTFSMDLSLVTEVMMVVTITGIFQETETDKKPLRYFSRTLIIVPQGSGYCIRNEQLHISDPTEAQKKQATAEISSADNSVRVGVPNEPAQQDAHLQMAMILSQQSGMNLEWSRKCLNEVEWNFEAALTAFKRFFQLGQVPPEAFIK